VSPTTPVAGTPPAQAETRRDGSESKPGVVVDKDNKSS
jgi:NADH-quinone oxidoreductase subunit E